MATTMRMPSGHCGRSAMKYLRKLLNEMSSVEFLGLTMSATSDDWTAATVGDETKALTPVSKSNRLVSQKLLRIAFYNDSSLERKRELRDHFVKRSLRAPPGGVVLQLERSVSGHVVAQAGGRAVAPARVREDRIIRGRVQILITEVRRRLAEAARKLRVESGRVEDLRRIVGRVANEDRFVQPFVARVAIDDVTGHDLLTHIRRVHGRELVVIERETRLQTRQPIGAREQAEIKRLAVVLIARRLHRTINGRVHRASVADLRDVMQTK